MCLQNWTRLSFNVLAEAPSSRCRAALLLNIFDLTAKRRPRATTKALDFAIVAPSFIMRVLGSRAFIIKIPKRGPNNWVHFQFQRQRNRPMSGAFHPSRGIPTPYGQPSPVGRQNMEALSYSVSNAKAHREKRASEPWTIRHLNALAEECSGSAQSITPGRRTWFRAGAPLGFRTVVSFHFQDIQWAGTCWWGRCRSRRGVVYLRFS